jgi:heptosyltransferase-2
MLAAPRRILVRYPNPLGDAVMATPVLRALRRAHPQAEITVLGNAPLEGLLRGIDTYDHWLSAGRDLAGSLRRVRDLRARDFDWAVILPDSPRAVLEPFLARVPRRAGYARDRLRRALLTDWIEPPRENGSRVPFSMIERYLRITRALGVADAGSALDLAVDPAATERVDARLAAGGIAHDEALLLVAPGAAFGASKLWPPAHFAEAGDAIHARFGLRPVVVAAPNDAEIAIARDVLARAEGPWVSLADPPGSLEDLKAIVARSALVLGNDTGPRHVAVALERPVVTLMGPNDPRHTAHLLEHQRVLTEDVPCRPCNLKRCPIDHRCMTRMKPERAVAAAGELLGATEAALTRR